jgi:uncharacterized membrane protein YeaQ/YmgE (transglycosylase-associated protein family)
MVANTGSLITWLITGVVAGYVASVLLRAERQGCLINIVLGVVGAFVGSFVLSTFFPNVFNIFGEGQIAGFFNNIFHAVVGAVLLLIIIELVVPGRQLGVRGERRRERRNR